MKQEKDRNKIFGFAFLLLLFRRWSSIESDVLMRPWYRWTKSHCHDADRMLNDMSNSWSYYHSRSRDRQSKRNPYRLICDDRNKLDDNQRLLWSAMQASCALLCPSDTAIGDIAINRSDQVHADTNRRSSHLHQRTETRIWNDPLNSSRSSFSCDLHACCRRLESWFSMQPSMGTLSFSEVKTEFMKFMYCFDVSLVVWMISTRKEYFSPGGVSRIRRLM